MLTLFLCLVACFTFVLTGVVKKDVELEANRKELQEIKKKLHRSMIQKSKSVPTSKLNEIKQFILPIDDSIDTLSRIEQLSKSADTKIAVSSASPKQYFRNIYKLDLAIDITGDINSVINTIKKLENLNYVSYIDSVKLTHKESKKWNAFLTLHMFMIGNANNAKE